MGITTTFISHKAEREKELWAKIKDGMTRAALAIERQAKINAEFTQGYQTGMLKSSITNKIEISGNEIIGIVGTNKDYAVPLEFGTYKMAAQPFLFPAVEQTKSQVAGFLKE